MKTKIIIIGTGGIGSRHFEALLKSKPEFDIEVRDFEKGLRFIESQFASEIESFGHSKIHFSEATDPFKFDRYSLAIIATGASNRSNVLRELINNRVIDNLILEKPIANSTADLYAIAELAQEIPDVRMNTPRENMEFYRNIKSTFFEEVGEIGKFKIKIIGSNWGLLSNCLHFIRLTEFLTGSRMESISEIVSDEIYESKRLGYFDIHGSLTFTDNLENSLILIDAKAECDFCIEINSESFKLVIDEGKGTAKDNYGKYVSGCIEYQSGLTNNYFSPKTNKIIASLPLACDYLEISSEILKTITKIGFPHENGKFKFT